MGEKINKVLPAPDSKSFVQVIPLKLISSAEHILFAAEQTNAAFKNGSNISKRRELEFLLRLTAQTHIKKALSNVKFSRAGGKAAMIISSSKKSEILRLKKCISREIIFKKLDFEKSINSNLRENFNYLKRTYSISNHELSALSDLGKYNALQDAILENVALVSLEAHKKNKMQVF